MQEFLLILKGDGMDHLSPKEINDILTECNHWIHELGDQFISGQRLENNGSLLISKESDILTDGPFLESKEIIAGYFLIQAESQDAANHITLSCPLLSLYAMEVRPISMPKMK